MCVAVSLMFVCPRDNLKEQHHNDYTCIRPHKLSSFKRALPFMHFSFPHPHHSSSSSAGSAEDDGGADWCSAARAAPPRRRLSPVGGQSAEWVWGGTQGHRGLCWLPQRGHSNQPERREESKTSCSSLHVPHGSAVVCVSCPIADPYASEGLCVCVCVCVCLHAASTFWCLPNAWSWCVSWIPVQKYF